MKIGIVSESFPGERRVALTPQSVQALVKAGHEVFVEAGAGTKAGFSDGDYGKAGGTILAARGEVFRDAEIIAQVRLGGANPQGSLADLPLINRGHTLVGLAEPLADGAANRKLAETGARTFALELLPRITRAQSMDVLSSQATVAGYEAVLLAAQALPRMFPMMMTAAGTLAPARVLVIGAGVAGLQAISTARRLGAVVTAYDIRPAVKTEIESLGAKFLNIDVEIKGAEGQGGYAKAMDEAFYRRQRELLGQAVAASDVVITTAAVPGKRSPVLVTADMVARMSPGSVIVDLAAERGGNCELTRADQTVLSGSVSILGPTNLPAVAAFHASQMYSRNVQAFMLHLIKDGALVIDSSDEIAAQTLLAEGGRIVNTRVAEALGLMETQASR